MTEWFAPGRVELLGKHTDYAGGRSLLMALDRGITVRVDGADAGLVATSDAATGDVVLRDGEDLPAGHWGNYLRTVVGRLERNFGTLPPARLQVSSTLPLASGMSSSSALMIAAALALADYAGLTEHPLWQANITTPEELATYLATIENGASFRGLEGTRGVGTFGGSQDHTAIICCHEGELAQYSFRGSVPVREGSIAWDPELSLVIAVSGVTAEKTGSAQQHYNTLAELTAEICARWNRATGRSESNIGQILATSSTAEAELRALLSGESALERRFAQFVAESEQCIPAASEALRDGDLGGFGRAVARSQEGADSGLRNQVEETRFLVRDAVDRDAIAASAFGAGFGGAVWALVRTADADRFAQDWLASYGNAYPQHAARATTIITRPHGGARRLGISPLLDT